jgi:hypothetical protein
MPTQKQESLLPGTRALPRGTVEWSEYHGKELIRYRRPDGITWQKSTADKEEAWKTFQTWLHDLEVRKL